MAMFSSREPFNDDPEPWTDNFTGDRTSQRTGYMASTFSFWPRPEYDRPQHNPTNPILAKLRTLKPVHRPAWIEGFLNAEVERYNWPNWTHMEIQHAYKVLTRLANLSN